MMKNMKNWMKKIAAVGCLAIGIVIGSAGAAFAGTETVTCTGCEGTGKTTCTWCDGTGQMSVAGYSYTCITCSGTGQMDCLACFGKGTKTVKTEEPAQAADTCTAGCGGVMLYSPILSSGGMNMISTQTTCPVCNGTGRKVCTLCSGFGFRETRHYGPDFGFGSSSYWTKSSCAACSGTGQAPCTHCGGDGLL